MKSLDTANIILSLQRAGYDLNDMNLDGFTQFEVKKELYQIKWVVDNVLKKSPDFHGEEQWLKEQEQKIIWETLTHDIQQSKRFKR